MDEATNILLDHAERIVQVLEENQGSPTRAYKVLVEELPEIKGLMSDRSFRSMVKLLPALSNLKGVLDNKESELNSLKGNIALLSQELQATKGFADKMVNDLEEMSQQQKNTAKVESELDHIRQQLNNKSVEVSRLRKELDAIRQTDAKTLDGTPETDKGAINIDGWTVRQRPNGFYYLYKTIQGKTKCLYLGKHLDKALAQKKIKAFEAKSDQAPKLFS